MPPLAVPGAVTAVTIAAVAVAVTTIAVAVAVAAVPVAAVPAARASAVLGATDGPSAEAARTSINAIANPHIPEVGERFLGTVVKTTTFGAFVSLLPGKDGLLHITQIRKLHGGARIENVDDVIKVGDKIQVEIREVDDRGKLSLVPVEVVEREAAAGGAEDSGAAGGRDRGDGHRGDRDRGDRDRYRGDRDGHRADGEGGGSHRTRHRERRHRDS